LERPLTLYINLVREEDLIQRARRALAGHRPQRLEATGAPAAVLLLVCERDGEPHLLFTERTHEVEHHKGEISFPGGACDDADADLRATALRETFEEIGVRPEDVEVIGSLDDFLTITDFRVTPSVGILRPGGRPSGRTPTPYLFQVHPGEVASIIEVPLRHLLDHRNMELELRQWKGKAVLVPAYTYGRHRIWGATARILQQLLDLLS
jgi:8-oxo-dGTP pyrophosphatase MutT (NUDIX family)